MKVRLILIIVVCVLFAALGALGEKLLHSDKSDAENTEEDKRC